jgi:formate dehydrogenase assembly factor FdhD
MIVFICIIGQSKYTLHIKAYLKERHLVLYVLAVREDVSRGNAVDALEAPGEMALIRTVS